MITTGLTENEYAGSLSRKRWAVIQTNTKAIQLYKRYGFEEEGMLIKDRIHKDGIYYNTVIMGRLLDKQTLTIKA